MRHDISLICFDVDGTLIKHPDGYTIWEVLNVRFGGTHERNRERYEMFKRDEITYPQWVEMDVSDWIEAGATRESMREAMVEFDVIDGARDVASELKQRGYRLAVISGTLNVLLDALFPDHPFEDVFTNHVFFDDDGRLNGWRATPFDVHGKPDALRELAHKYAVPLERTAFVGDGENDVPLLGVAGYFVAYRPKSQALEKGADRVIMDDGLHSLLDIFKAPDGAG